MTQRAIYINMSARTIFSTVRLLSMRSQILFPCGSFLGDPHSRFLAFRSPHILLCWLKIGLRMSYSDGFVMVECIYWMNNWLIRRKNFDWTRLRFSWDVVESFVTPCLMKVATPPVSWFLFFDSICILQFWISILKPCSWTDMKFN